MKGTDNKVADVLSHIETHLDDDTVKKLLESCPTTEIKGLKEGPPNFKDHPPEGEDSTLCSKVRKEAVNEVIQRARHVLCAEADNPALIEKHEEIEREEGKRPTLGQPGCNQTR